MKTNLLAMLFLFTGLTLFAQEKTVTGTVTSADDGLPLPGANVSVQNTTKGTTTDFDGNYEIEIETGETLVFSYVGFEAQEIVVNEQETINISLNADTESLSEVVVIGYGTSEKQDLTGSIGNIKSEEIVKQPALTATQAIQGKLAGVNIVNSDAPGSTPTVTIRGLGTALGGRNPLYIVDGTTVTDIKNISPSSIESIDVLKDASSASIYGVRAANGVIIVTTKKGKGKPKFTFNSYYGVKSLLNQVEMANAQQYITYFNEENAAIENGNFLLENQRYDTDWIDELTKVGAIQNNVFQVSGSGENIDYYFNFDYFKEDGILEGQDYRRTNLTNKNTYHLFEDKLKITHNLNLTFTKDHPKPFSAFNNAYRQSPLIPVYYSNGRYGQSFYNQTTGVATYVAGEGETVGRLYSHGNPVAAVNFANGKNYTTTIQGNVAAELEIIEGLTFTSRIGMRKSYGRSRDFNENKAQWIAGDPTRTAEGFEELKAQNPESLNYVNNSFSLSKSEVFKYNWDNFLNYKKSFGNHNIDVTLGGSREELGVGNSMYGLAYDVREQEQYQSIDNASDAYEKTVNQSYYTPTRYISYFARGQYNFNRKYYATATVRRDGSSVFKNTGEYFDYFPSFGLGWTVSNESFLENNETINYLKVRASYGELGNAQIPFNATQIYTDPGSSSYNYVFGPDQRLVFGAAIGSPARELTWEVVEEWNVGIDFELLNRKLTGSVDLYKKTTPKAILQVQPLLNSPYRNNFYDYGAEIVNKGIEVALGWSDKIGEDFSYNINGTFTYNSNELVSIKNNYDGQTGGSLGNSQLTKRLAEGQPVGSWWMYEADGVWQTQDEIDNNASLGGAKPGHLRYKDQNEDGVIDDRDKKYFGSYIPKYNVGLTVTANYKQFDFSVNAYGAGGNKIYNGLLNTRLGNENIPEEVFNERWTEPGSTNTHPGANRDALASSYYLEDGDYIRINNITLGYTLPDVSSFISNARIYVSAQNPFLFTDYSGFTPEINSDGNPYGTTGIELAAYPNTRTILMGLNLQL